MNFEEFSEESAKEIRGVSPSLSEDLDPVDLERYFHRRVKEIVSSYIGRPDDGIIHRELVQDFYILFQDLKRQGLSIGSFKEVLEQISVNEIRLNLVESPPK